MGRERRAMQDDRTVVAVGLTGGIGAGKSTALSLFEECGAMVLSADAMVHQLYQQPEVASLLAEHFGSELLDEGGAVDRVLLAQAVRGRTDELRWVEEVTHPLVAQQVERGIQEAPAGTIVVCEVPLLFETGFERLFDLVVTIEADPELRRLRSTHVFGMEQFVEFEALQTSGAARVAGADLVFVNDGGIEEMRDFVKTACAQAREMLSTEHSEGRR